MAEPLTDDDALDRLRAVSDEIVERVEAAIPAWVVGEVHRILEAWTTQQPTPGGPLGDGPAGWEPAAREAGEAAARRVGAELRSLFATEAHAMTRTPLEVVRSAVDEPTALLGRLGVPPVARDEFATRSWPADTFGLTPANLADLGDPDLGPLLLAWGALKAAALRADDPA